MELENRTPVNSKQGVGRTTLALIGFLCTIYVLEVWLHAEGNAAMLFKLGALPDNAQWHGQVWRLASFGFLHYDARHLFLNVSSLLISASVVENRIGGWRMLGLFLFASICSGIAIMCKHIWMPTLGSTVGASGGMFGMLAAAMYLLGRNPARSKWVERGVWAITAIGFSYSLFPQISLVGHLAGYVSAWFICSWIDLP